MYQVKSTGSILIQRPADKAKPDAPASGVTLAPGSLLTQVPAWVRETAAWKLAVSRGDIVEASGTAFA